MLRSCACVYCYMDNTHIHTHTERERQTHRHKHTSLVVVCALYERPFLIKMYDGDHDWSNTYVTNLNGVYVCVCMYVWMFLCMCVYVCMYVCSCCEQVYTHKSPQHHVHATAAQQQQTTITTITTTANNNNTQSLLYTTHTPRYRAFTPQLCTCRTNSRLVSVGPTESYI